MNVKGFWKDITVSYESRRKSNNIVASIKCLQMEDTLVASGSADATVRFWDLSRSETLL